MVGQKIEGARTLRLPRPLSIVPQSGLGFPAQSGVRIKRLLNVGKGSRPDSLWKPVQNCAKRPRTPSIC